MATAKDTQFKKGMTPWNKGRKIIKVCTICDISFSGRGVKYCSLQCAGRARLGMVFSENLGREKGCVPYNKGKKSPETSGERNGNWIADRSKIKVGDRCLNDPLQKGWRRAVKNSDGWKCRIADENCNGRLEAHHILPWSKFPELRYQINNGITLCHAHHPWKRDDVAKLSPYFQSLVASRG